MDVITLSFAEIHWDARRFQKLRYEWHELAWMIWISLKTRITRISTNWHGCYYAELRGDFISWDMNGTSWHGWYGFHWRHELHELARIDTDVITLSCSEIHWDIIRWETRITRNRTNWYGCYYAELRGDFISWDMNGTNWHGWYGFHWRHELHELARIGMDVITLRCMEISKAERHEWHELHELILII